MTTVRHGMRIHSASTVVQALRALDLTQLREQGRPSAPEPTAVPLPRDARDHRSADEVAFGRDATTLAFPGGGRGRDA
jgi:hypothetical protein